jgi:hypothetical protein
MCFIVQATGLLAPPSLITLHNSHPFFSLRRDFRHEYNKPTFTKTAAFKLGAGRGGSGRLAADDDDDESDVSNSAARPERILSHSS